MKNDTSEEITKVETKEPEAVAAPRVNFHKPTRRGRYIAASLVLIFLCFSAGLGGAWLMTRSSSNPIASLTSGSDGNKIVTSQEQDIAGVASKVSPSVVSIITKGEVSSYLGTQTQEAAGTGIIISSDGYIVTNKHVVSGSTSATVVTSDGTTHSNVKVIGTDPLNDLAFLKIDGTSGLTAATLGDSTTLRTGQSVVAIGNALGQYQNTVTSGIISGTGRSVTASAEGSDSSSTTDSETLTDLIQTDAAINPGNSGGPLVNIAGQVIGINTAVASDANGLGFSIPINAAKGLIKGVLANGKVERGYLGVNYVTITAAVAEQYKLPVKAGAYVFAQNNQSPIVSGSPADKAGIKSGDIITKVNDTDVGDKGSVSSLISSYAPGDSIKLTILRDGKTITIDATLDTYKASN